MTKTSNPTKPSSNRELEDQDNETGRDRSGLDDRDDEGSPQRVSSPAGERYAGDHKNHGEPELDLDDAEIEEIDLDELPDSEGPDA